MTSDFSVSGRVAVVTGASSGIGRTIATALSEMGAQVVGVARRERELENWCAQVNGETSFIKADLNSPEGISDLIPKLARPFGWPDLSLIHISEPTRPY